MDFPHIDSGLIGFIAAATISFIAWLVRLESKIQANCRDLDRIERRQGSQEDQMSELDLRMMEKLSRIEQIVAKIEGTLDRERFS